MPRCDGRGVKLQGDQPEEAGPNGSTRGMCSDEGCKRAAPANETRNVGTSRGVQHPLCVRDRSPRGRDAAGDQVYESPTSRSEVTPKPSPRQGSDPSGSTINSSLSYPSLSHQPTQSLLPPLAAKGTTINNDGHNRATHHHRQTRMSPPTRAARREVVAGAGNAP